MSIIRAMHQLIKGRNGIKSVILVLLICLSVFIIRKSPVSKRHDMMGNRRALAFISSGSHRAKENSKHIGIHVVKSNPLLARKNTNMSNETDDFKEFFRNMANLSKKNTIWDKVEQSMKLNKTVKNLYKNKIEARVDNELVNIGKVISMDHIDSRPSDDYSEVDDAAEGTLNSQDTDDGGYTYEDMWLEAHAEEKPGQTLVRRKSCIKYVSIYTPRLLPFKYWREYVHLDKGFLNAKDKRSPYYDSRIIQRREFPTMFIKCPGNRCDVVLRPTVDEAFLDRSDAVVINMAPHEVRYKMPRLSEKLLKTLPVGVKVFFYAMESPMMMSYWDHTIKDIKYHESMTYVSGSDVHLPYGRYINGKPMDTENINYAQNKTGLLVWTASNCNNTFWPRLEWVRNLQKLLVFDTYGKCGLKTCLPPLSPICTKQQAVYKFYLALENAECNEYITEKVWVNGLMNGVVPIVYGGRREAYERVLPPNSFIHIGDFSSQRALVDYILMVNKNDTLYNEFFAWRRHGHVEKIYPNLNPRSFCRILEHLMRHEAPSPVKRIGDSKYFRACRGEAHGNFTHPGDINNWSPWR